MKTTIDTCGKCGRVGKAIKTDNKLVGTICLNCLSEIIDFDDINDLKLLSETLRVPFNPNQFYLAQINSDTEEEALESYFEYLEGVEENGYMPEDGKMSGFDKINEEWTLIKNHHSLLLSIPIFRAEFEERNREKWGYNFSFEELVRLENLYTTTLKTYNITDPFKRDAVKKAAITSLEIDNLILTGDGKAAKELTTVYQHFLKIADIEQVSGVVADDGTIRTVADLIAYLEAKGYHVESNYIEKKDIVDMTLDNILENTKLIVSEKTGIDVDLRSIIDKAQNLIEEDIAEEVYTREALSEDYYTEIEKELEADLETDEEFNMEDVEFLGE